MITLNCTVAPSALYSGRGDGITLVEAVSLARATSADSWRAPSGATRAGPDGGERIPCLERFEVGREQESYASTQWRRSTHALIGVAVVVLVAAVVAVAGVFTTGGSTEAAAVKPTPAAATANPAVVPVADSAPKPIPGRLAAALAPALADPNLGKLAGQITDAMTGAQLWAQAADLPMQPASTNKTLTAAAALLTLDREHGSPPRCSASARPEWWCSRAAVTRPCRRSRRTRKPGTATRRGSATWPTR